MAQNEYVPANVSLNELLKYHLQVSSKVDNEIAVREAKKTLALLDNPPKHVTHQHAQISHDYQKTPVNENNKAAVDRVKKEKKVVETEKKVAKATTAAVEYKVLSPEETATAMKEMEQQVKNASTRTVSITPTVVDPGTITISSTAPAPPWLAGK